MTGADCITFTVGTPLALRELLLHAQHLCLTDGSDSLHDGSDHSRPACGIFSCNGSPDGGRLGGD